MQENDKLMPASPNRRIAPEPGSGAYCSETRRIVVISPFPEKLHEWVRELTSLCYDVMLFHHADPLELLGMQADLVVIDAETLDVGGERAKLIRWAGKYGKTIPLLWLVQEQRHTVEVNRLGGHVLQGPASMEDAVASVQKLLQLHAIHEYSVIKEDAGTYTYKEIILDSRKMSVTVAGRPVALTKTEYSLLCMLMEAGCTVIPREDMLNRVWGSQFYGGSNVVDVHMKSLRKSSGIPRQLLLIS
ncbi:winged-helix domain-containing protein [Paenibacillus sp. MBLB4367]|uniref:winged helix-turn-helix transcriptional regulator n=1 Tax=Paenibacillus sp. MBLB4367 TaxID=3384767 RepID=UPI003907FD43